MVTSSSVPIQCHNTQLQRAFGMITTEQYINLLRKKFIKRLLSKAFTREIVIYTVNNQVLKSLSDKYSNMVSQIVNIKN